MKLTPFRRCPECNEPIAPGVDHFCNEVDRLAAPRGMLYGVLAAFGLWLLIIAAWKLLS